MAQSEEMRQVCARMRDARLAAGITQEEAAKAVGVTRATISNQEAGRSAPSLEQFRKLIAEYGAGAHVVLYGRAPVEFGPEEIAELRAFTMGASPGLRAKLELVIALRKIGAPDQRSAQRDFENSN